MKRQYENVTTVSDYDELRKAYRFVPEQQQQQQQRNESHGRDSNHHGGGGGGSTWQDRMVAHYHSHLYKSHVVADMTRYRDSKLGLRWRTRKEVSDGKGFDTCGNKFCPSYYHDRKNNDVGTKKSVEEVVRQSKTVPHRRALARYLSIPTTTSSSSSSSEKEEERNLNTVPEGVGLYDYRVHFAYVEHSMKKEELVKLRLCLRCAPMLFYGKGGALTARVKREKPPTTTTTENDGEEEDGDTDSSLASVKDDHTASKRRKTRRSSSRKDERKKRGSKRDHRNTEKHRKRRRRNDDGREEKRKRHGEKTKQTQKNDTNTDEQEESPLEDSSSERLDSHNDKKDGSRREERKTEWREKCARYEGSAERLSEKTTRISSDGETLPTGGGGIVQWVIDRTPLETNVDDNNNKDSMVHKDDDLLNDSAAINAEKALFAKF